MGEPTVGAEALRAPEGVG